MLTEPKEIEIISKARQKNVRDPGRSLAHFERIFNDFFTKIDFRGKNFLDLGPGHYDFGELARQRGARVLGVDDDPAVLELGRHKQFSVREAHIQQLHSEDFHESFDGIFCKFSYNAFWFRDGEHNHREAIRLICSLLRDDGWGWIAPWNGIPRNDGLTETEIATSLSVQISEFIAHGFNSFEMPILLAKYYGVHGLTANRALFVRNLPVPNSLARCRAEAT